jgi:hypothetical protein
MQAHESRSTSLIIDPREGRMPPLTPEAEKAAVADQEFRLALLRPTETCKSQAVQCRAGKYDPAPSPRRAEPPPRYIAAKLIQPSLCPRPRSRRGDCHILIDP